MKETENRSDIFSRNIVNEIFLKIDIEYINQQLIIFNIDELSLTIFTKFQNIKILSELTFYKKDSIKCIKGATLIKLDSIQHVIDHGRDFYLFLDRDEVYFELFNDLQVSNVFEDFSKIDNLNRALFEAQEIDAVLCEAKEVQAETKPRRI